MRPGGMLRLLDRFWSELLVVAVVAAVGLAVLGLPFPALVTLVAVAALQYLLFHRRGTALDKAAASAELWQERAETLRDAARKDPESGLGSRQQLLHDWGMMAAHYERTGEGFALVLIEVRHPLRRESPLPEEAVTKVAAMLHEMTSPEDSLARLDAHSFAVLFAGADQPAAREWLTAVQEQTNRDGGVLAQAHVTMGAADHDHAPESLIALLRAADADTAGSPAQNAVA